MGDGSLSQEEIDALLMGADDMGASDPMAGAGAADMGGGGAGGDGGISPSEREILADSFNEAMTNAASSVSSLVGKTVTISSASVEEVAAASAPGEIAAGSVLVDINMGAAKTALIFTEEQAKNIAGLMMGAGEPPAELNDAILSTLGELSNTLLGSIANNLRDKFGTDLNPSPPNTVVFSGPDAWSQIPGDKLAKVTYNFAIEGASSAKMVHYIQAQNASGWAKSSSAGSAATDMSAFDDMGLGGGGGGVDMGGAAAAPQGVPINPVNFPSLQQSSIPSQLPPNLELLLDVQMVLTVELGRTKKYVKDILSLGEGSIIELDKLAGEPVDLLINGKLIAKGEVVVIDENFGVRVTDIVGPAERLGAMTAQ